MSVVARRGASLSSADVAALVQYAASHGRTWKAKLRADWENGRCQGELQMMRNTFGPSWLASVDLRALRAPATR